MATKFFYVRRDGDETIAFPVDNIRSFHMTNSTLLNIQIDPLEGATGTAEIELTITEGKSEEVIKSIIAAGRSSRALFISIADKVTGKHVNSNISDVAVVSA